jgi:hypothetical protein
MHVFGKLTQSVLQRKRSQDNQPTVLELPTNHFSYIIIESAERTSKGSTWRCSRKPVIQLKRNFEKKQHDKKNFDHHVLRSNESL